MIEIIVYVCPDCGLEAFRHELKERKTWLGKLVTPISFTAQSNCDSCAQWLHQNFHIKDGLYAAHGISVKTL